MAEVSRTAGRVLVTGAYGFIGAAYCAYLERAGIPYLGAVRERRPTDTRLDIVPVGDFNRADWTTLLCKAPVASVVHLAARAHRTAGKDSDKDKAAVYRRENVKVTDRLLAAARVANVRRFVFASTVKVHGEATRPGIALRESDPLAPQDDYARSKAAAEQRVHDFGQELGLETVVLRLPLVYGPGVKANFAELVEAVRGRRVLPLGSVRNKRSLLGLTNLCSAIDCVRAHPQAAGETFFVADEETVSTPQLVEAIATALGVRPRLWSLPPGLVLLAAAASGRLGAGRRLLQSLAIDSARIRRTLGWSPPLTLAAELERLAAAMRRNDS